jgi:hypothetical protein
MALHLPRTVVDVIEKTRAGAVENEVVLTIIAGQRWVP